MCATANTEAADKAGASAPQEWASFWKGPCFCASGRGARAGDRVVVGVRVRVRGRACVRAFVCVRVCDAGEGLTARQPGKILEMPVVRRRR